MSENIEKAVPTEESPKTKESETSAPAATDNVVLYPVADISAAQETTDTETAASKEITDPQNTDNQTTIDSKTTDGKAADNADKFSDTRNTKEFSKKDAEEDEDLEEDFYEQQEKSRSKEEHPFREFFSNFRSKRKIEMNRDEQILSRISDEDLMEYLRMEQKRMELLQHPRGRDILFAGNGQWRRYRSRPGARGLFTPCHQQDRQRGGSGPDPDFGIPGGSLGVHCSGI